MNTWLSTAKTLGGGRIDVADLLDHVAEELDPDGERFVRRVQLHHIAPDAEGAPLEVDVVAGVLDVGQPAEQGIPLAHIADPQGDHAGLIVLRRAQPEDARDRRHHDAVAPGRQAGRGREPQPVQVGVAGGVLLDVDIALRDVRFRLIIIVIADEILDRVLREELLELLVELGGQGLIVRDDQHGPVELGDDVGHREGLAAAGYAHQGLKLLALAQTLRQPLDGLRLVARRPKLVIQLECTHSLVRRESPLPRRVLNPCSCCSYTFPAAAPSYSICCKGRACLRGIHRSASYPLRASKAIRCCNRSS